MRTLFEARLVNDAFGDPGLYVDFPDERRAILFDLGDITALPPRYEGRSTALLADVESAWSDETIPGRNP